MDKSGQVTERMWDVACEAGLGEVQVTQGTKISNCRRNRTVVEVIPGKVEAS